MKNLSNRRAKACAIPKRVKDEVWERDSHECVWFHTNDGLPEAHFISRSHGGLGIPENILTLSRKAHDLYDNGPREQREAMREYFRQYLKSIYPGWNESKLVYRK